MSDWQSIGTGLTSDWHRIGRIGDELALDEIGMGRHLIGTGLMPDCHRIDIELASDWLQIGMDWHLIAPDLYLIGIRLEWIGTRLALDCCLIDIGLASDWNGLALC